MDGATAGWIGGIAGSVIGVAGGAVGTYFSIARARGEAARAFMIRCAIVVWIVGLAFVAGVLLLPSPWRFLIWLPYGVVLPLGIIHINRRLAALEDNDGTPQV